MKALLGTTGLEVSRIGLGAWGIGGVHYGEVAHDEALAAIVAYLDGGGNFIDTARAYGRSEELLGEVLPDHPDAIVVSKTPHTAALDQVSLIRRDIEESLTRLRRDRIDVELMHQPSPDPHVRDAVLTELESCRDEGLIGHVGASIAGPTVTDATEAMLDDYVATGRIEVVEVVVSVLRQRLLPAIQRCHTAGVGVIVRTALESGFLSGRYPASHVFGDGDHRHRWSAEVRAAIDAAVVEVAGLATVAGATDLVDVAARFPLAHAGVSTVILGATTAEQVRRNHAIGARGQLDAALQAALEAWGRDRTADFNP